MANHERIQQIINTLNIEGRTSTFAEFVVSLFKDKFIEIYLGDAYEEVSTEQISVSYPAVFCGKVIAAYRECLVIDCAYIEDNKTMRLGNTMLINERAIRAVNEIDEKGIMEDMFLRSKESLEVKRKLGNK